MGIAIRESNEQRWEMRLEETVRAFSDRKDILGFVFLLCNPFYVPPHVFVATVGTRYERLTSCAKPYYEFELDNILEKGFHVTIYRYVLPHIIVF